MYFFSYSILSDNSDLFKYLKDCMPGWMWYKALLRSLQTIYYDLHEIILVRMGLSLLILYL